MNKFTFTPLALKDVILIEPKRFEDNRGFFSEIYNQQDFAEAGISGDFIQDNLSFSHKDIIRGLHLQRSPHEISKLVRCVKGEIFDVAVDLRSSSKTFGK